LCVAAKKKTAAAAAAVAGADAAAGCGGHVITDAAVSAVQVSVR